MKHPSKPGVVAPLSYSLAAVVTGSSLGGILLPEVYARETASWGAQGLGQDWVNLILVAPLLAGGTWLAGRGRRAWTFLLAGAYFYLLYSYVLYAFCMHFNRLYFLYIAGLGLSTYALVLLGLELRDAHVETWFDRGRPTRLPALYLLLNALLFSFLWLSEDIPAVLSGEAPKSLAEVGLITNPVHVLDLGIVLPAMATAAWKLLRKEAFGYLLFPVMMVFCMVMAAALLGMAAALKARTVTEDLTLAWIFGVLFVLDAGVLAYFLRGMRRT